MESKFQEMNIEPIKPIKTMYKGYSLILGKWIIGELETKENTKYIKANLETYYVQQETIKEIKK